MDACYSTFPLTCAWGKYTFPKDLGTTLIKQMYLKLDNKNESSSELIYLLLVIVAHQECSIQLQVEVK